MPGFTMPELSAEPVRRWLWRVTLTAALLDAVLLAGWIALAVRATAAGPVLFPGPGETGIVLLSSGAAAVGGLAVPLAFFHAALRTDHQPWWRWLRRVLVPLVAVLTLSLMLVNALVWTA